MSNSITNFKNELVLYDFFAALVDAFVFHLGMRQADTFCYCVLDKCWKNKMNKVGYIIQVCLFITVLSGQKDF